MNKFILILIIKVTKAWRIKKMLKSRDIILIFVQKKKRSKTFLIFLFLTVIMIFAKNKMSVSSFDSSLQKSKCKIFKSSNKYLNRSAPVFSDYLLLNNSQCKIPDVNPFSREAMDVFKRQNSVLCSDLDSLVFVEQNLEKDLAVLRIKDQADDFMSWWHKNLEVAIFFIFVEFFRESNDWFYLVLLSKHREIW